MAGMPSYWLVKQAHAGFAVLSISLLLMRTLWSAQAPRRLEARWVRVVPHINDSLLLACGLYLAINAGWNPWVHSWLAAKLIALLVYIGCGSLAIRYARTPRAHCLWGLSAAGIFGYIALVAVTKNPLPLLP